MGFEYGYRFARQAAADVTGIVDYLAGDLANPTAAASFKKSLMECLDTLRMFPQSGSLCRMVMFRRQGSGKNWLEIISCFTRRMRKPGRSTSFGWCMEAGIWIVS